MSSSGVIAIVSLTAVDVAFIAEFNFTLKSIAFDDASLAIGSAVIIHRLVTVAFAITFDSVPVSGGRTAYRGEGPDAAPPEAP